MGIFDKKTKKLVDSDDLAKKVEEYNRKALEGEGNTVSEASEKKTLEQQVKEYNKKFLLGQPTTANNVKPKNKELYSSFFAKHKSQYKVHPKQLDVAEQVFEECENFAEDIIKAVHYFHEYGHSPLDRDECERFENVEDLYKTYLFQGLIRTHLQFALYGVPQTMETVLALCDKKGKPHLKAFISMSDLKPLFAYSFDKLIVPIANGADPVQTSHSYSANMPSWMQTVSIDPKQLRVEEDQEVDLSDTAIIDNFNKVSRFVQASFFPAFVKSKHVQAFLVDPEDARKTLGKGYRDTWVTTNLMHSLKTVQRYGYDSLSLDQYPNQGLNIAAMFLFCMHQINQDVTTTETAEGMEVKSMKPRYDPQIIARYPEETQLMASQSGSYIFEELF